MVTNAELVTGMRTWAPDLEVSLNATEYLGSESCIKWLIDSKWTNELKNISRCDGYSTGVSIWARVVREKITLPAPGLLLILEHLRVNSSYTIPHLEAADLKFDKTLANVASRAADSLFDCARTSFAGEEFDVAIARLRVAIAEFRFSIESGQLSDTTRRIATGKYAAAIAMIGRWIDVTSESLERAISYSQESIDLGNLYPETLSYRLELLMLQFDRSGSVDWLVEALELLSKHKAIAHNPELIQAEIYFSLALSTGNRTQAKRYLNRAEEKLSQFSPETGVERVRLSILTSLASEVKERRIEIPARSIAFPRGLLILMATEPSAELWNAIRNIINGLEELRNTRELVPAAIFSSRFLRQMKDGPNNLLTASDINSYVQITTWLSCKVPWNRHIQWEAGMAALSAAKRTESDDLAHRADEIFKSLASSYNTWPLPRIGIAQVQDYLVSRSLQPGTTSVNSWREAAELALSSSAYARSSLGGRNEVFAVADARGYLSQTFVLKRTTKAKAEHEAAMLSILRDEIVRLGYDVRYQVPRSLAIVQVASADERKWVHVTQRAAGRLVSELYPDEATSVIEKVVELLAIFHRVAGQPEAGRSAWKLLKAQIRMWAKTLFGSDHADQFVQSLHYLFPGNLPLVRKRDGHASNWLLDPAGRIVAIDLESSQFVPLGYDVAQLIEDNALIPASPEGWTQRLKIFERYVMHMGVTLGQDVLSSAYGWFAIARALRLGTEKEAGKRLRRHAREICGMLVGLKESAISKVAHELLQVLSRIEQTESLTIPPSHDHRRLSKSMARQLRHIGPINGLAMDNSGFIKMEDLAFVLKVDVSKLLAVAEHPSEPRFEVRDGRIRALYGHTFDVKVDAAIKIGAPTSLYHGSNWEVLNQIVHDGLIPMKRQMVHLTNNKDEAMLVGARKGSPIVFGVEGSGSEEPVAEGIWVVLKVEPQRLSILNPYLDQLGASR